MARDTIVLSPEYVGHGKGEALVATATVDAGQFVAISSGNVVGATAAVAVSPRMVAVENVSNASGIVYTYAIGENCHFRYLPSGVRVNMLADAATYNAGDELEVGVSGLLAAQSAGVTVAVVPPDGGEVISAGGFLMAILV